MDVRVKNICGDSVVHTSGTTIAINHRGGGRVTPIYWLYGYVPLERVWFSIQGLVIIENWSRIGFRLTDDGT